PERVALAPLDEAGRLSRIALVHSEEQISVLRPAGQRLGCFVWHLRCWVTGQYGRPSMAGELIGRIARAKLWLRFGRLRRRAGRLDDMIPFILVMYGTVRYG